MKATPTAQTTKPSDQAITTNGVSSCLGSGLERLDTYNPRWRPAAGSDYLVLVYDAENHNSAVYDYDPSNDEYTVRKNGEFGPVVYTKEKFLVRVCNLHPTDTVSIAGNSFTLPEQGADIRGTTPTTVPALAPTLDTLGSASAAGSPFSPAGVNFGSSAPLTSIPISGFTLGVANKDTGYTDAVLNVSPEALAFETVSLIRDAQDIVHTIQELNSGDQDLHGTNEGSIASLQEQANRMLNNLNENPATMEGERRLGWFNQRLAETQQFVSELNGLANGVSQAGLGPRAVAIRQNFESILGVLKQIHQVDEDDWKIDKSLWAPAAPAAPDPTKTANTAAAGTTTTPKTITGKVSSTTSTAPDKTVPTDKTTSAGKTTSTEKISSTDKTTSTDKSPSAGNAAKKAPKTSENAPMTPDCQEIYNHLLNGDFTKKESIPADVFTCRAYERYLMRTFLVRFNLKMDEILTTIATKQAPEIAGRASKLFAGVPNDNSQAPTGQDPAEEAIKTARMARETANDDEAAVKAARAAIAADQSISDLLAQQVTETKSAADKADAQLARLKWTSKDAASVVLVDVLTQRARHKKEAADEADRKATEAATKASLATDVEEKSELQKKAAEAAENAGWTRNAANAAEMAEQIAEEATNPEKTFESDVLGELEQQAAATKKVADDADAKLAADQLVNSNPKNNAARAAAQANLEAMHAAQSLDNSSKEEGLAELMKFTWDKDKVDLDKAKIKLDTAKLSKLHQNPPPEDAETQKIKQDKDTAQQDQTENEETIQENVIDEKQSTDREAVLETSNTGDNNSAHSTPPEQSTKTEVQAPQDSTDVEKLKTNVGDAQTKVYFDEVEYRCSASLAESAESAAEENFEITSKAAQAAKRAATDAAASMRRDNAKDAQQALSIADQWQKAADDIDTYGSYLDLTHPRSNQAGDQPSPGYGEQLAQNNVLTTYYDVLKMRSDLTGLDDQVSKIFSTLNKDYRDTFVEQTDALPPFTGNAIERVSINVQRNYTPFTITGGATVGGAAAPSSASASPAGGAGGGLGAGGGGGGGKGGAGGGQGAAAAGGGAGIGGGAAGGQGAAAAPASPSTGSASGSNDITVLLEVHRLATFNMVGGVMAIKVPTNSFSAVQQDATTWASSPAPSSAPPGSLSYQLQGSCNGGQSLGIGAPVIATSQPTTTTATAYYCVEGTQTGSVQVAGMAGIEWFIKPRDYFPYKRGTGTSAANWIPSALVASSVTSLGSAFVGPNFEPVNGFNFFAGYASAHQQTVSSATLQTVFLPLSNNAPPTITPITKVKWGFSFGVGFDLSVFQQLFTKASGASLP
jgi:hypothetical protein